MMSPLPRLLLLLMLQGACQVAVRGIRLTAVHIPAHVQRGQSTEFECEFDLEDEVLYTVKWYKDGKEFYQYVPAHEPPKQTFPLPGLSVDLERSTLSVVTLLATAAMAAGDYRCEVSGEAPNFNTVSDARSVIVVELPNEGPVITGGSAQYCIGDVAELNCTSAASRPPAELAWSVNGRAPPRHHVRRAWTSELPNGTFVSTAQLRFRVTAEHFKEGNMKIKCVASVASEYERWDGHSASAEGADNTRPLAPEPVLDKAVPDAADTESSSSMEPESISDGSTVGCGPMTAAVAAGAAFVWSVHLQCR